MCYFYYLSDIKPENILVSSSGDDLVVKLGDFGFSKKEITPNCLVTLCGTPSYAAPEGIESNRSLWKVVLVSRLYFYVTSCES